MPKILTDKELGDIIWKATHDPELIQCQDSYIHFLEDLGDLICTHFGGRREGIGVEIKSDRFIISFLVNECVPFDGGVFKDYDTDVTWKDGIETCR
ncbi:MAG: hypothetical protein WC455_09330 [Dehalococcoidia bacterium]|jgi:hypothetical protein